MEPIAPQRLGEPGVGPLIAAKLVGEIGGGQRFRAPTRLARAAGVAAIPACSGNTQRHRLDQGDSCQISAALHRVIVTRARCDGGCEVTMGGPTGALEGAGGCVSS